MPEFVNQTPHPLFLSLEPLVIAIASLEGGGGGGGGGSITVLIGRTQGTDKGQVGMKGMGIGRGEMVEWREGQNHLIKLTTKSFGL